MAVHLLGNRSSVAAHAFEHVKCPPCRRVPHALGKQGLFAQTEAAFADLSNAIEIVADDLAGGGNRSPPRGKKVRGSSLLLDVGKS